MKRNQFNLILLIIILMVISVFPQTSSSDKYLEMKNSLVLGLEEKGLEICSELLSRSEYKDIREEVVFYIAEYFFVIGLSTESINNISQSYTYYFVYQNDYPNSKYSETVNKRITTLESFYKDIITFRNLFDLSESESEIVKKKLDFVSELYTIEPPNPYTYFLETEYSQPATQILNRYFDDIIINHPDFEIYGYNMKILTKLSLIRGVDFIEDKILEFDVEKYDLTKALKLNYGKHRSIEAEKMKLSIEELDKYLGYISEKYPTHPITLNLHLIYCKIFMVKDDGKFDAKTKEHLEFVVKNELDKTHPRYLLAREFLLNNKFN